MNKLIRITTVPVSLKILLKGQHWFMCQNGFDVLGVSSSGNVLNEVAQNEKIAVDTVEMTRIISPLKDIKSLWKFYLLCRKEKPTIVHSHTPKAGIIGMLGAKLAGVPIRLHTVAGLPLMEATGLKRRLLILVEKLTYSSATKVYPNSQGLYDFVLANNLTKEKKLKVIANGSSNGIDTSFFDSKIISEERRENLKKQLGIHSADFIFVFVGRLVANKGINELVEAFSQFDNKHVKLILVGQMEEDLDPLSNKTLDQINTNPNILSVGFQEDVRPYFTISDCLVFPSYREGFPNVVMQAGAMGLPCIVTDINGCNEIILEGKNGIIIPAKNVSNLKEAMHKIFTNNEWRLELKLNSRPMISERYEQKVIWEALLAEYKSLLAQKNIPFEEK